MRKIDDENCDGIFLTSELQKGVWMEFRPGETVTAFIQRVLSLDYDRMKGEVQTLILNNGCVDEPDSTELIPGDTLVLSGAMPGLVGAMLRSDSPIKAMRQTLSRDASSRRLPVEGNRIRLKLFNTILSQYKERILSLGFYMEEEDCP